MIALCTGRPAAEREDERIIVSFPSGKDHVEVSLDLNQALSMIEFVRRATHQIFDDQRNGEQPKADIIAMPDGLQSLVRREIELRQKLTELTCAAEAPVKRKRRRRG